MTVSSAPRAVRDLAQLARIRELAATGQARNLRARARLSQSEVARACGVSPALVSRWEAGERVPRGKSGVTYAVLILGLADAS